MASIFEKNFNIFFYVESVFDAIGRSGGDIWNINW